MSMIKKIKDKINNLSCKECPIKKYIKRQKDIDSEITKIVDENFWDLLL